MSLTDYHGLSETLNMQSQNVSDLTELYDYLKEVHGVTRKLSLINRKEYLINPNERTHKRYVWEEGRQDLLEDMLNILARSIHRLNKEELQ